MTRKKAKNSKEWASLRSTKLGVVAGMWFATLENKNTKMTYMHLLDRLFALRLITKTMTISDFAKINSNKIVDKIKNQRNYSEATKQARAAAFISFTKYLSRLTDGRVKRALPEKFGTAKTFYSVRDKVKTKAMEKEEYLKFRSELQKISPQHRVISDVILQGAKRISEVLSMKIENIDFDERKISFKQSKTRGKDKQTIITYPKELMNEIFDLVGERKKGFVFIKNRNKIPRTDLNYTFAIAGRNAKIEFKITPHVLRATGTTLLKALKYSNEEISKMTGTTPMQVGKYDKTDIAENPSVLENLIQ